LAVAGAVARSLRDSSVDVRPPPADPFKWRSSIERSNSAISLDVLLRDLWARGVPVVPVDILPTPKFQGLACIIDDRPIIVVGHQHDAPGRLAFVLGHEAGHIAAGDCALGHLIVDQDEEVDDQSEMERLADQYATRLLVGSDRVPTITATDFRELAKQAISLERAEGIDATTAIFAWARATGNYTAASMAVQALYRHTGGRALLRKYVLANVDFDSASESDRSLLRLVVGDSELAAAAD
jgi:Zn-dependent peptidase ImmA (M78 family)